MKVLSPRERGRRLSAFAAFRLSVAAVTSDIQQYPTAPVCLAFVTSRSGTEAYLGSSLFIPPLIRESLARGWLALSSGWGWVSSSAPLMSNSSTCPLARASITLAALPQPICEHDIAASAGRPSPRKFWLPARAASRERRSTHPLLGSMKIEFHYLTPSRPFPEAVVLSRPASFAACPPASHS